MSIYMKWVSYCNECAAPGPTAISKGSLIKALRLEGWKIKRETRESGAKHEHLACPTCIHKAIEEANRVAEKVKELNGLLLKAPMDAKGTIGERLAAVAKTGGQSDE